MYVHVLFQLYNTYMYVYVLYYTCLVTCLLQDFWDPTSPIQTTIIVLIKKIVVAMGDELKVYIPPLIQHVLRLFLQDQSEQKMVTHKVSGRI